MRGVAFTVFQTDFAAEEHFAATDYAGGVRQAFSGEHAVAAPCHVCGVDVAVGEAEACSPTLSNNVASKSGRPIMEDLAKRPMVKSWRCGERSRRW